MLVINHIFQEEEQESTALNSADEAGLFVIVGKRYRLFVIAILGISFKLRPPKCNYA